VDAASTVAASAVVADLAGVASAVVDSPAAVVDLLAVVAPGSLAVVAPDSPVVAAAVASTVAAVVTVAVAVAATDNH
jgi:hypothetical protein